LAADKVVDSVPKDGAASFHAAALLGSCVPLAAKDGKLPEARRRELAETYAH
jgi:hypothetical protein